MASPYVHLATLLANQPLETTTVTLTFPASRVVCQVLPEAGVA